MRARIPTLIVSVAGAIGFSLFGLAAPAQAAPYTCYFGYIGEGSGSYAYCLHGTGQVRALATCIWPAAPTRKVTAYGGWVKTRDYGGTTSYANCPATEPLAIDRGYETKA